MSFDQPFTPSQPVDEDQLLDEKAFECLSAAAVDLRVDLTDPEQDGGDRMLYPPIVRRINDAKWWGQMVQCFDRLIETLDRGEEPRPICTGDEIALWLVINEAEYLENACRVRRQGIDPTDYWDFQRDALFQESDFRMLYSRAFDGVDDPADDTNGFLGIGDRLQPKHWFDKFDNADEV